MGRAGRRDNAQVRAFHRQPIREPVPRWPLDAFCGEARHATMCKLRWLSQDGQLRTRCCGGQCLSCLVHTRRMQQAARARARYARDRCAAWNKPTHALAVSVIALKRPKVACDVLMSSLWKQNDVLVDNKAVCGAARPRQTHSCRRCRGRCLSRVPRFACASAVGHKVTHSLSTPRVPVPTHSVLHTHMQSNIDIGYHGRNREHGS